LRASEQFVLGQSALAGPVSVPWTAVATIEFGGQADPHPAFSDWVLRDPPPLPSFDEAAAQQQSDWLNKQAPDFNVDLLDGAPLTLSSLRGRPVVLDFWATWCGPCIASMPSMIELARDFEGKVEFIAINQQEDPEEVREFVTSRLWNLRVGLDVDGSLNRLFGVNAIPYTLIIDPQGVVRHVHIGATPDLKAELTEVLNGLLPADGR
jgi:thiol-disulfide isomerase/thioredoxin